MLSEVDKDYQQALGHRRHMPSDGHSYSVIHHSPRVTGSFVISEFPAQITLMDERTKSRVVRILCPKGKKRPKIQILEGYEVEVVKEIDGPF